MSSPGPATLWGILQSEEVGQLAVVAVDAPNAPNAPGVGDLPVVVHQAPVNPAVALFGDEIKNLVTPPFAGNYINAAFFQTATDADLIRLNEALFAGETPTVRDLPDPSVLLENGNAAEDAAEYGIQVGMLVTHSVPILAHIEMLRPVERLYWMFVDPRDQSVHRVVHVHEDAAAWKIVLLAIYGKEDFYLDPAQYPGESFVQALVICQTWRAVDFVRDTVMDFFKFYCYHMAAALQTIPAPAVTGVINANPHERVLQEIQRCYLNSIVLSGEYQVFKPGAFGAWAIRAIGNQYLSSRLSSLSRGFARDITIALALQVLAHINGTLVADPIFI